jgi:hypothetical protein
VTFYALGELIQLKGSPTGLQEDLTCLAERLIIISQKSEEGMPRPKIRASLKDHKVTIRLDNDTYQTLKEAIDQGVITNLSETLRGMIRQRLWVEKFSKEIENDLKLDEVSYEDLRAIANRVLRDFDGDKRLLKMDGVLEAMFSVFGGLVRRAIVEAERREADINTARR